MSYYRTCLHCGSHLDPGEKCDCKREAAPVLQHRDGGMVEQVVTSLNSTSIIHER